MKNIIRIFNLKQALYVALLSAPIGLTSCEDVIKLDTETGPAQLVVDGWITNQPGPQTIRLTWSAGYFDNSPAKPILGAEVTVTDDKGKVYEFKDLANDGKYIWETSSDTLGHIGRKYTLKVKNESNIYTAVNEIKRVPKIDSIVYQHETYPFEPDKGPKRIYRFILCQRFYWCRRHILD